MKIEFKEIVLEVKEDSDKCGLDLVKVVGTSQEIDFSKVVKYMDQEIPSFALKKNELKDKKRVIAKKSKLKTIIKTGKARGVKTYSKYAELLMFCILNEKFKARKFIRMVCKKGGPDEEGKGFDFAHANKVKGVLTLWLGEVKMYKYIGPQNIKDDIIDLLLKRISKFNEHLDLLDVEEVGDDLKEREVEDALDLLSNCDSKGTPINLNVPIFILTDKRKNDINEEIKNRFKTWEDVKENEKLKIKSEELAQRKGFNTINFIFIILPIDSIEQLRNKIEKESEYAA